MSCIWGYATFLCQYLVDITEIYDIVLHGWCKAFTFEGSTPNSLKQHVRQVDGVSFIIDTIHEESQQINGCLVQHASILNSDVINHIPWILLKSAMSLLPPGVIYLLQCANQTFERTLGTIFGKGGLLLLAN